MKRNDPLKEYFAGEVEAMKTPPFPSEKSGRQKKRIRLRDDLMTWAAAAAVFALILTPGVYDNTLRRAHMPRGYYERMRETIPRLVYDAAVYMQEQIDERS